MKFLASVEAVVVVGIEMEVHVLGNVKKDGIGNVAGKFIEVNAGVTRMECSPEHVCHLPGPCQKALIFDRKGAITLI